MQMPAKFHEIPSMGLQDIKETKRYGRTDGRTHGRTDVKTVYPLKLRFGGGGGVFLKACTCILLSRETMYYRLLKIKTYNVYKNM